MRRRPLALLSVLTLAAAARADVAPPLLLPQKPTPPAPSKPVLCARKTEELAGPRGSYREVTGPVYSATLKVAEVTPPAERRAVERWFTLPNPALKRCYRFPAPALALAPTVSLVSASALFSLTGQLSSLVIASTDSRLDLSCAKAALTRPEPLAQSSKHTVLAKLELSFAVTCPTVTCPSAPATGNVASYGRKHDLCD